MTRKLVGTLGFNMVMQFSFVHGLGPAQENIITTKKLEYYDNTTPSLFPKLLTPTYPLV